MVVDLVRRSRKKVLEEIVNYMSLDPTVFLSFFVMVGW